MLKWLTGGKDREGRGGSSDGSNDSGRLAALLRDYPPATPPHRGTNGSWPGATAPQLTLEQCRENLAWQGESMPARLAALAALLDAVGLAVQDAYADDRRPGFITALDRLLVEQLPATYTPALADRGAWEASDRAGSRIVHSFLADLAWLEGDIMIAARPGSFWGLDLDPADSTMLSYRRPCLLGLSDSLFPAIHHIYHLEGEWFGVYRRMDTVYPGRFGDGIGSALLQRLARDIVAEDLPQRRATGWLAKAV